MQPTDLAQARALVPSRLALVRIAPGKTLGGICVAAYGRGSTLEYHELIVVPALVRLGYRIGAWISHIYVDAGASLAGGRAIWGLPKEFAAFTWDHRRGEVSVSIHNEVICNLRLGTTRARVPLPLLLPVLCRCAGSFAAFHARGRARVALSRTDVEVPASSPFHALGLRRGIGVHMARLDVRVFAPQLLDT
jgi:acetoacetate decarboxylase